MHERGIADHELIDEHEREKFAGTSADARRHAWPQRADRDGEFERGPRGRPRARTRDDRDGRFDTATTQPRPTTPGAPPRVPPSAASGPSVPCASRARASSRRAAARRRGSPGRTRSPGPAGSRAARAVSTPSAITSSPRLCASPTIALARSRTRRRRGPCRSRAAPKIFTASPGKRCSSRSDDAPVPKSSMCAAHAERLEHVRERAPRAPRRRARGRARETSRRSARGSRPVLGERPSSSSTGKSGSTSWRCETLTPSVRPCAARQRAPLGELRARALEHLAAERDDQPRLLGDRHEVRRLDRLAVRAVPARERLEADDPARRGLHDRLVGDLERVGLDRAAQVGLEVEPAHHLLVHARRRTPRGGPCRRPWRGTSRRRRRASRRCGAASAVGERDPDRGGDEQLAAVEVERVLQRLLDALGDHGRLARRRRRRRAGA